MSSLPALNPVIHAQSRLRVMVSLHEVPEGDQLTFQRLQHILDMTAGNLSVHIRKLEEVGYLAVDKTFEKRTPTTYLSLTVEGRQALKAYIEDINQLLKTNNADPEVGDSHG